MTLKNFKKIIGLLRKDGSGTVKLLGGEPTIHSRFKDIVSYAISQKMSVKVFTNGLFSHDMALWLASKGARMRYSFNLSTPAFSDKKSAKKIEQNIRLIIENSPEAVTAGIRLDSTKPKLAHIMRFLKTGVINRVSINLAANIIYTPKKFKAGYHKKFAAVLLDVVRKLNAIGIEDIVTNCGITPCMFSKVQMREFLRKVSFDGWGCNGKRGTLEISSDGLTVFKCFAAEPLGSEKISKFKDAQKAGKYFKAITPHSRKDIWDKLPPQCIRCRHFKKEDCPGPCFSYIFW